MFCTVCIVTWLQRNTTCPICRAAVEFPNTGVETTTSDGNGTASWHNRAPLAAVDYIISRRRLHHADGTIPGISFWNHESSLQASAFFDPSPHIVDETPDSGYVEGYDNDTVADRSYEQGASDEEYYDQLLLDILERDIEESGPPEHYFSSEDYYDELLYEMLERDIAERWRHDHLYH
jgi:hypothetical protein